jgi:hypothetical protein
MDPIAVALIVLAVLMLATAGIITVTERSNAATEERCKSGHEVGGLSIV